MDHAITVGMLVWPLVVFLVIVAILGFGIALLYIYAQMMKD